MAVTNFGQETIGGSDYAANWCRLMGGNSPNIDDMILQSVSIYVSTQHAKQVRVAVYQGGTTTIPTNATLLEDLGQTSGSGTNQWLLLLSATNPTIVKSIPTWIAIKGNTSGGNFLARATTTYPTSDFYSAHGRTDVGAMGADETAAFSATVPSGGVSADFWYSFYLTYSFEPPIKDWSNYQQHGTASNSPTYTYSPLKMRGHK